MIGVGEVYRHNNSGVLVEVKDVSVEDLIYFYFGYPKDSYVNNRTTFIQNNDTFLQYFTKLTPLELELL